MNGDGSFEGMLLAIALLLFVPLLLLRLFLGGRAFSIFKAHAALEFVRAVVAAPFKLIGYFFRTMYAIWSKFK